MEGCIFTKRLYLKWQIPLFLSISKKTLMGTGYLKQLLQAAILVFFSHFSLMADEILLSIGGRPITTEEFKYIYQKNNINNSADFSRNSLENYLELFINYKLKVQEALDLGMDTIPELSAEYKSYESQLFEAYLNKQLMDPLVKQAYERSKTDVGVSHIFISHQRPGSAELIQDIHRQLLAGASFEKLASQYSQDENSAQQGGKIGYFTALQIGFPQLEDAAFQTEVGAFSNPVETPLGFHIVKVFDKRVARGRIKVAIIKRIIPDDEVRAKATFQLMDSLYKAAISGADFGDLATRFSEDQKTNLGAGEMDWFGINTYASLFEEAAFSLEKDGDISKPINTGTSLYLIKRLMATRQLSFEEAEPVVKAKLQKSKQFALAMESFYDDLKRKYDFKEHTTAAENFKGAIEEYVNRYPFKFQEVDQPVTLLTVQQKDYTTNDVGKVLNRVASKVVGKVGAERVEGLYEEAMKQILLDVMKEELPLINKEYKSLLEEYRNGVLIFDLTRTNVWNRAVTDSIGLKNFFESNRDKYQWNTRAFGIQFLCSDEQTLSKISALYKKNSKAGIDEWRSILKTEGLHSVEIENIALEQGVTEGFSDIKMEKGPQFAGKVADKFQWLIITDIQKPSPKNLNECRGFVIAAYQEALDKSWIAALRTKYPVAINSNIFEQLVKKP
jgi:peptidyl-prolyl cis-trans isomerase SurA